MAGKPGTPASTGAGRSRLTILAGLVVVVVAAVVFVVAVVGDDAAPANQPLEPIAGPDPGVAHVHGLGVDPKDGTLYAATHTGVFRLPESGPEQGRATRVANRHQDTMGFTVIGPGTFLGSGHPDQREDLPDSLGLIESTDGGQTWQSRSLAGEADFHALEYKHDLVFGYEAGTGRFMVSKDKRSWDERAVVPVADFAVSPATEEVVMATTQQGLARSIDGARTFSLVDEAPALLLVNWPTADALVGATADGTIHVSGNGGQTWEQRGKLDGQPQALTAVDARTIYAATESGIYVSKDGGRTFELRYGTG